MELRIAGIVKESVVDGPGLRFVIFTQGCPHGCPGCHNPQTHDPQGGSKIDTQDALDSLERTFLIRGVTFSGGEPFMQAKALAFLAAGIKEKGFDIVTYTGFLYEELLVMGQKNDGIRELLKATDILIDGPYRAELRDLRLAFRGSRNQRIIDVPASVARRRIILWEDQYLRSLA